MTRIPSPSIAANTIDFETKPLVKPTGFREYDARWWFGLPDHEKPSELNLYGVQALGEGLGTLMYERGVDPKIAVGHDFRHYSLAIKLALTTGLMNAGIEVLDIGMALSPMAYFAQFHLDCAGVAMVTASHNSNGWTGVKMGIQAPLTFGPDEMARLKEIVLNGESMPRTGGSCRYVDGVREAYIADLVKDVKLSRPIRIVAACGNGTAGAFAEEVLRGMGADIARHPEIGRVAEAQQAAEPQQQVEGAGKEREAQHLHGEDGIDHERQGKQDAQQKDEDDLLMPRHADRVRHGGKRDLGVLGCGHQAVFPNRPSGLIISTMAMITKMTTAEPSG